MSPKAPDKWPLWKSLRKGRADAEALLAHFHQTKPPIDVDRMARALDIEISEGKGRVHAGKVRFSEEQASLWLSVDETTEQRRFALACLLAHLMLDPPGEYRVASALYPEKEEPRAVSFAKELLMPRAMVQQAIGEQADRDGLHRTFAVPDDVMDEWLAENEDWKSSLAERRREERVPARIQIKFAEAGHAARALKTYSINLSTGGICLKTNKVYQVGDVLNLDIGVESQAFELEGVVSWVKGGAIGVRFQHLSKQDRERLGELLEWLRPGS